MESTEMKLKLTRRTRKRNGRTTKKVEDKTRLSRKKNNFRLPQFTSDWKGWATDTETRPEGVVTARVLDGRFPSAAQHWLNVVFRPSRAPERRKNLRPHSSRWNFFYCFELCFGENEFLNSRSHGLVVLAVTCVARGPGFYSGSYLNVFLSSDIRR